MVVLKYKRPRLIGGGIITLAIGIALAHWGSGVIITTFGMLLIAAALRLLYLATTDLAAVRCGPAGLHIRKTEWTRTIPWTDYQGVELKVVTFYALGFIPTAKSRIVVFTAKAPDAIWTRTHKIGLDMLECSEDDIAKIALVIEKFAASAARSPQPAAAPRAAKESPAAEDERTGWETRALDVIAAVWQSPTEPGPSGAAAGRARTSAPIAASRQRQGGRAAFGRRA